MNKKFFAILMALLMILSMLVGCADNAENDQPGGVPSVDPNIEPVNELKTFAYGVDANSTTFDPAADLQNHSGYTLVNAVLEPLWSIDEDGEMVGVLAESFEWTGDLELKISLRQGVTFSNGNELGADDVIYTLEHLRDTGRTESMVACVDFEATNCPDTNTVCLVLKQYDAAFIDTLSSKSFGILDRETCTAPDWNWGWLIGTGPYKLQGDGISDKSGWEEAVQYNLVRNDSYWGTAPYYDEIIIKFYSEESTRYSELLSGSLDAAYITQATYINSLQNSSNAGISLVREECNNVFGFTLSAGEASNQSMADINIRKAFAHGINITEMVEILGENMYTVATSILGENHWAYENVGVYEYDPDAAREYLALAGYSVDNPLTLKVVAESTAFNSALCEAAQQSLSEVGIILDLTNVNDWSAILPILLSGEQDISIGGPSNGSGNDPASHLQTMSSNSHNVQLRVTEPNLVELFDRGSASKDQEERINIYREFQQGIHDQYLYIPLWVDNKNYGVKDGHTSFASAFDAKGMLDPTLLTD